MKTMKIAALAALLTAGPLTGQAARWVAPVYPGAVDGGETGTFLSAHEPGRVIAFYEARLGPARLAGESVPSIAPYARPHTGDHYWIAISFDQARSITGESLNENMYTTPAGLLVRGPLPERELDSVRPGELRAVGSYFDQLETMVRLGSMDRARMQPLVRKYRHLARMHYPRVERDGRLVPLYQVQSQECGDRVFAGGVVKTSPAAGESVEAMTERMQALLSAGEVQEALKLQQRIMEKAMAGAMAEQTADAEADGIPVLGADEVLERVDACLADLAKGAYPTLITISTHPSQWTR